MLYTKRFILAASVLAAAALAGCREIPARTPQERLFSSISIIENWSNYSRLLAAKFIEKYGPPDLVDANRLTWNNNGPWKKTIVYDKIPYYSYNEGPDNLEQTVSLAVPAEKRQALREFSTKLRISRDGQEVIASSSSETIDFLLANLANDIITGAKTPEDAKAFYSRAQELSVAGKSVPYMEGLVFQTDTP